MRTLRRFSAQILVVPAAVAMAPYPPCTSATDPKPVARALEAIRGTLGGPIRILSGPPAVAAAVALELPEHPLVLIDGRRDESPWVSKAMERAGGVVEIGATGELPGGHPLGSALPGWSYRALPSSRSPKKPSAPSD